MRQRFGDDWARIGKLSIIEETASGEKTVRMAYLAVIASSHVNGVAAIHSDILKHDVFAPFYDIFPEKFGNKTNGVTPRRWLAFCNPPLRALISETLGGSERWINDTDQLKVRRGGRPGGGGGTRWGAWECWCSSAACPSDQVHSPLPSPPCPPHPALPTLCRPPGHQCCPCSAPFPRFPTTTTTATGAAQARVRPRVPSQVAGGEADGQAQVDRADRAPHRHPAAQQGSYAGRSGQAHPRGERVQGGRGAGVQASGWTSGE